MLRCAVIARARLQHAAAFVAQLHRLGLKSPSSWRRAESVGRDIGLADADLEQAIRDATDLTASVAPWLQADHEGLTGKVLKWPERAEIDAPVQESLIVELYSK